MYGIISFSRGVAKIGAWALVALGSPINKSIYQDNVVKKLFCFFSDEPDLNNSIQVSADAVCSSILDEILAKVTEPLKHFSVHWIRFENRATAILLNNDDEVIPMITVANILLLKNAIVIPPHALTVTEADLLDSLCDFYITVTGCTDPKQTIWNFLAPLKNPIEEDPFFNDIGIFGLTPTLHMLSAINTPALHAWIPNPCVPYASYLDGKRLSDFSNVMQDSSEYKAISKFKSLFSKRISFTGLQALLQHVQDGTLIALYTSSGFQVSVRNGNCLFLLLTSKKLVSMDRVWQVVTTDSEVSFVNSSFTTDATDINLTEFDLTFPSANDHIPKSKKVPKSQEDVRTILSQAKHTWKDLVECCSANTIPYVKTSVDGNLDIPVVGTEEEEKVHSEFKIANEERAAMIRSRFNACTKEQLIDFIVLYSDELDTKNALQFDDVEIQSNPIQKAQKMAKLGRAACYKPGFMYHKFQLKVRNKTGFGKLQPYNIVSPVSVSGEASNYWFYLHSNCLRPWKDPVSKPDDLKRKLEKLENENADLKKRLKGHIPAENPAYDPKNLAKKTPDLPPNHVMSSADGGTLWGPHPKLVEEKPYECNYCDMRFKKKTTLQCHRSRKHAGPNGIEEFRYCPHCNSDVPRHNYTRHVKLCQENNCQKV